MKGQGYAITAIVLLVIALAAYGIYAYWHWSFYDQAYNVSGQVSAYHKIHDVFGFTEYNLEFFGGSNVSWTQNKSQSLIFTYVGNDVNASAGQYCYLAFKGTFMQSSKCVNSTK